MNELGKHLQQLRESKGWSKTFVAEKLKLKNMATYANWEYGTRLPDAARIKQLANLYETTTDYLLGNTSSINDDGLTENQKLIAYSIDPDITDEEREAIIEMAKQAKKFRRRI